MAPQRQSTWWFHTIPHHGFVPYLPPGCRYIKGQLERGADGFLHWQLVSCWFKKKSLAAVRKSLGTFHAEILRSEGGKSYVWKEETRVDGTQFELGSVPISAVEINWEDIRAAARAGNFEDINASVYVRNYSSLRRIAQDNLQPHAMERIVAVFWGRTGTGKSRDAWQAAGLEAYPKDPLTRFWDGYRSNGHVVIDEFRGGLPIESVLRWFDRYPVNVETKGSSTVLCASHIWITSNLHPRDWYPSLDADTLDALLRRLVITHYQ